MRLIDADKLIYELDASDRDIYCKYVIEEAPTAYDVKSVVEQLEKYKELECDDIDDDIDEAVEDAEELYDIGRSQGRLEAYLNAIEIVKSGGKA